MNEQQPYEKHLAEKFEQLPLPAVEPNWQQMKLLLDKEMPRGGGYWRWITAFGVLLFMLGGTWIFISRQNTGSLSRSELDKQTEESKKDTQANLRIVTSSEQQVQNKDATLAPVTAFPEKNIDHTPQDLKTKTIDENLLKKNPENKNTGSTNSGVSNPTNVESENIPTENRIADRPKNNPDRNAGKLIADGSSGSKEKVSVGKKQPDRVGGSKDQIAAQNSFPGVEYPVKNANVQYNVQNFIFDFNVNKLAGNSIGKDYLGIFPEGSSVKAQKSGKLSGKTKSAKPSAYESVQNRVFALGFSLPMGFPLGDQAPAPYNINAKPNTVSDFLPVPHMQYHINNKVYLQTEFQLMNPQYIQPVLLSQNKMIYTSSNTVHYNSVYAKKLYYFNIPVGIHYSPFPHFYLGTGLQFSSLVSGVALHEETSSVIGSTTSTLLSEDYSKFKNDSISDMIDNSEFRLMLDANYYWKQFTVGLRYNQALSNYVSFRLNSVSPIFTDKNKSLQFYLRYNLWEDYKRKKK